MERDRIGPLEGVNFPVRRMTIRQGGRVCVMRCNALIKDEGGLDKALGFERNGVQPYTDQRHTVAIAPQITPEINPYYPEYIVRNGR